MLRYADYDIVFQEIPDEVTLAINLSNCPNHCKGCHSAYLMEDVGEPLTEESLSTLLGKYGKAITCVSVSYTHLRAHETRHDLVCRLLLEKKKKHIRDHETDSYIV